MERNSDTSDPVNESGTAEDLVITSELEKQALLSASIHYLSMMTWHEKAGRLPEEFIAENNALRGIVRKLVDNLKKNYSQDELTALGINEISKTEE